MEGKQVVPVFVELTKEQYESIVAYWGQFMRDLPETTDEMDLAVQGFTQDLVEQWIDYYGNEGSDEDEDEDEDEFDEMGATALQ